MMLLLLLLLLLTTTLLRHLPCLIARATARRIHAYTRVCMRACMQTPRGPHAHGPGQQQGAASPAAGVVTACQPLRANPLRAELVAASRGRGAAHYQGMTGRQDTRRGAGCMGSFHTAARQDYCMHMFMHTAVHNLRHIFSLSGVTTASVTTFIDLYLLCYCGVGWLPIGGDHTPCRVSAPREHTRSLHSSIFDAYVHTLPTLLSVVPY
jgi:hypothetical protein